jgi:hypothetical protein
MLNIKKNIDLIFQNLLTTEITTSELLCVVMDLDFFIEKDEQTPRNKLGSIKSKIHGFRMKLRKYIRFFRSCEEIKEDDKLKKCDVIYIYNLMVLYFENNEYKEIYEHLFNCETFYNKTLFYKLVQNKKIISCNICLMDFNTKYFKCKKCTFNMCLDCEPKIKSNYLKCVVCKQ